jgi:hypothetical protein
MHDHGTAHPGQSHGDWLRYSNAGATRNDPLDPRLIDAMSFVGDMGITMDVISGGQEAAGEGGSRTGSTRHDHGQAADVDFYMGGRKLDWNNPDDLPILAEIVKTAKSRGVTGIGAGDDYMGAGRFHVGFGNPGVWGAGGKGAIAPEWLVAAYNGAPAGASPPQPDYAGGAASGRYQPPGGVVAQPATGSDQNPARLAWAYANGKMSPEDAAMYEQGMAAGVFPQADKPKFFDPGQQLDPATIYQMTAMRPRQPFQPVALNAGLANATPWRT